MSYRDHRLVFAQVAEEATAGETVRLLLADDARLGAERLDGRPSVFRMAHEFRIGEAWDDLVGRSGGPVVAGHDLPASPPIHGAPVPPIGPDPVGHLSQLTD
jgi:hypothetical protein